MKSSNPTLERPPEPDSEQDERANEARVETGGKAFVVFCANATKKFLTNNGMQMAAAVAFYSFFSLFPLSLLIILSFDFFVIQTSFQEEELARAIGTFVPVSPDTIATSISQAASSADVTGPLALIALIWASTAVFATLRKGINTAWDVRTPRNFLRERVIDLTFTAGAGILFLSLLLATTAIRALAEDAGDVNAGLFGGPSWLAVSSLFTTAFAFALLFRFLPNKKVRLRDVIFAAVMSAVAFEIAKGLFFLYTQSREDVNQIYGEFTSVAVLLGWLYISAAIVLIGGLAASIYSRLIQLRIVSHIDVWTFGVYPGLGRLHRYARQRYQRWDGRAKPTPRSPEGESAPKARSR